MVDKISGPPRSALRTYAWWTAMAGLLTLIGSSFIYWINQAQVVEARFGTGLGIILLLAALLRPKGIRKTFNRHPVKYVLMNLAFIGVLVALNVAAIKYKLEYDLTETSQFTLSPQTIQTLKQLDQPVEVMVFLQSDDPRLELARDYLQRYTYYTHHLSYEFHDPDYEPALVKKYKLTNYGLVFVSGSRMYETCVIDEPSITASLLRVTSGETTSLVSIYPKQPTNRPVSLTSIEMATTMFATLIAIPVAVLIAGVMVWWRRR